MHERTAELRQIMKDNGLKGPLVAKILGREPGTVRVWMMADSPRPIPFEQLYKLKKIYGRKIN